MGVAAFLTALRYKSKAVYTACRVCLRMSIAVCRWCLRGHCSMLQSFHFQPLADLASCISHTSKSCDTISSLAWNNLRRHGCCCRLCCVAVLLGSQVDGGAQISKFVVGASGSLKSLARQVFDALRLCEFQLRECAATSEATTATTS